MTQLLIGGGMFVTLCLMAAGTLIIMGVEFSAVQIACLVAANIAIAAAGMYTTYLLTTSFNNMFSDTIQRPTHADSIPVAASTHSWNLFENICNQVQRISKLAGLNSK